MKDDVRAAIQRAKQNRADSAIPVLYTAYGQEFTFEFMPSLPVSAMDIIARVNAVDDEPTGDGQIRAVIEVLDMLGTDDTTELLAELMREDVIGLAELGDVMKLAIGAASGRPFTSSSSSEQGSSTDGDSSTDGAPPEPSTPPPSPSTGS